MVKYCCWLLLCCLSVYGQPDTTRVRKKTSKAGEITVTALRQPEKNLEVPLSITIVPKELFQGSRGFGLDEALSLVPGVLVQSRTGNQDVRVVVRGFGARGAGERSNAGTSRGLRFYMDGIPETEPDGRTAFDLIDIAGASRIEVIRSNASALWGNAAGGVISISTVPAIDQPFISLQAQFGSFGFQKHSLRAGMPTEIGKVYATLNNTMMDGYRQQSRSFLTQVYAGMVSDIGNNSKMNVFLAGASNFFEIPGPLTQQQFEQNPAQAQNDPTIYNPTYVQRSERRFNRLGRIGTTFEHNFDVERRHTLMGMGFLQSKYLQRSERGTFRDFNRYHLGGNLIYRHTAQVAERTKNILLLGLDEQYQDGAILFYNLVNGSRGTTVRDNRREGAENFGVFIQNELNIAQKWSVVGGLRYDNISYYAENYLRPAVNDSRIFERLTPKLGLTFHISPLATLYANLGGGVEAPAGNETDPPSVFGEDTVRSLNPLLEPIRSTTFELGYKAIPDLPELGFLTAMSFDVALYLVQTENDIVPYRGGRFYFTAGKTRRYGIEASIHTTLQGGFSVYGAATLANNSFVEYRIDSVYIDKQLEGKFAEFAGNKMPGLPDVFASLRLRWEPPGLPEILSGLYAEVEYRGIGRYFADDANTLTAPSYSIVDGLIGYKRSLGEHWAVFGFFRLNNMLNSTFGSSIWINPDRAANGQYAYIEPGLPRNSVISLQFEWKF